MEIDAKKFSFGRNETFFLRYGWIAKGFEAYKNHSKAFIKFLWRSFLWQLSL